jgi:hypothetical protein
MRPGMQACMPAAAALPRLDVHSSREAQGQLPAASWPTSSPTGRSTPHPREGRQRLVPGLHAVQRLQVGGAAEPELLKASEDLQDASSSRR